MNRFFIRIAAAALLAGSFAVQAGTQVLGVEIGVTTADQLQRSIGSRIALTAQGTNKYSGGPMLGSSGAGYGIDGLNEVTYIFDTQGKLSAVLMEMGKHRFDAVYKAVSAKYKVVSQKRPFVGNQYARFEPGDAVIEIDAPHMSFEMGVRYVRNDLMKKFRSQSKAEADAKETSEAAKF